MSYCYIENTTNINTNLSPDETTEQVETILKTIGDKCVEYYTNEYDEKVGKKNPMDNMVSTMDEWIYDNEDENFTTDNVVKYLKNYITISSSDIQLILNTDKDNGDTDVFDVLVKNISPLMKGKYTLYHTSSYDTKEGMGSCISIITKDGKYMDVEDVLDEYFDMK